MKKNFFGRFKPSEKNVNKSVSMPQSDWEQLEAYRLYGSAAAGCEIPMQSIIREILMNHTERDRDFAQRRPEWIAKLNSVSSSDQEATHA